MENSTTTTVDASTVKTAKTEMPSASPSLVDTALDTLTRCLVLAINLESTAKSAKTDNPAPKSTPSATAST